MSEGNTLIFKNSGILYFRLIVTSIIALIVSRYLLLYLGSSDYGLYNVVGGIVVMMAFFNSVMISATNRFIAFELGKGDVVSVNRVFNVSLILHIGIALVILLLTETIGVLYVEEYLNVDIVKVTDAKFVLRFSSYATIITIVSVPYQSLITAKENFFVRSLIEIVRSVLALFVVVSLIYYTGNKLKFYALLISIINIVPAILFFIYCKKKFSKLIAWNLQKTKEKYLEILSFSSWNLIGASAHFGKTTGVALIINNFFGTLLNAAYGIANQLNTLVLMFSMNLAQAAIPQITKSFSVGDNNRTLLLATYISKYTWFLMLIPGLPLLLETEFLLDIWLVNYPKYTVSFCRLMIIATFVSGLGNGLSSVIEATGKIKFFQLTTSVLSLLSLPISYFLFLNGFEPKTIFIIIIVTNFFNVIISQVLLRIIINFDVVFFMKKSFLKIFYVLVMIFPIVIIHTFVPENFLRFILFIVISFIWTLFSIYTVGLEKNEKEVLKKTIKKIKISYR